MRRALALTCLIAAALSACGKKADDTPAVANAVSTPAINAPVPTPAAAAEPALPAASTEACAVLATYVKVELKGDFGLPVMIRVPPAKGAVTASELTKDFPGLGAADAKVLAERLTQSIKDGSQLGCDWKALGVAPPSPVTAESNAAFRLRPVAAGDVGLLETHTEAGATTLGSRCLYRKTGGAWRRDRCVLTALN